MNYTFASTDLAQIIVFGISFIVLLIGTFTDFKTREEPDWLNYVLIITGI